MLLQRTGDVFRGVRARWGAAWLTLAVVYLAVVPSCQIVGGYQSFEPGDGGTPDPCDALPSSKLDAKALVTLVLSKQPDGSCYWIDQTEVTVQEYEQFLHPPSGDPPSVDWSMVGDCGWKTAPSDPASNAPDDTCAALTSSLESDPFDDNKPIRCVDWCDAEAFCLWAGTPAAPKTLCGGSTNGGGGVQVPSDVPDQWGGACSPDGLSYMAGSVPILEQCNVGLTDDAGLCFDLQGQRNCAPTAVGKFTQCVAPSGALDMLGNVAEWVLTCGYSADGGPDSLCQHRGGSFADSLDEATCYGINSDALGPTPVSLRDRSLGFRCCAALTAAESGPVTGQ
jgi:formylglycine-generating enzyme